ncbi:hypothetical protein TWF730_003366 [Orbilia blumenaviensis]|uniref:Uncharacterized protein n=1 Tax=Orbilia blumenaviensis TaxID=1796055 RepID=A0AAV9U5R1_9PEZI
MRSTLCLFMFAAIAASMPQSVTDSGSLEKRKSVPIGPIRCSLRKPCVDGMSCVGERHFKGSSDGICVMSKIPCGGGDGKCSNSGGTNECVGRSNLSLCPADTSQCGYCVLEMHVNLAGKQEWGQETRCRSFGPACFSDPEKGSSFNQCLSAEAVQELDICPEWFLDSKCDKNKCADAKDKCMGMLSEDITYKVCIPAVVVEKLESKASSSTKDTTPTKAPTCKSLTRTVTEVQKVTKTITQKPIYKTTTKTVVKTVTVKGSQGGRYRNDDGY